MCDGTIVLRVKQLPGMVLELDDTYHIGYFGNRATVDDNDCRLIVCADFSTRDET